MTACLDPEMSSSGGTPLNPQDHKHPMSSLPIRMGSNASGSNLKYDIGKWAVIRLNTCCNRQLKHSIVAKNKAKQREGTFIISSILIIPSWAFFFFLPHRQFISCCGTRPIVAFLPPSACSCCSQSPLPASHSGLRSADRSLCVTAAILRRVSPRVV